MNQTYPGVIKLREYAGCTGSRSHKTECRNDLAFAIIGIVMLLDIFTFFFFFFIVFVVIVLIAVIVVVVVVGAAVVVAAAAVAPARTAPVPGEIATFQFALVALPFYSTFLVRKNG